MTDNVALLINLLEYAESGKLEGDLEISHTYYAPDDFMPKRDVRLSGAFVCTVSNDDMMDVRALNNVPVLSPSVFEKYVRMASNHDLTSGVKVTKDP